MAVSVPVRMFGVHEETTTAIALAVDQFKELGITCKNDAIVSLTSPREHQGGAEASRDESEQHLLGTKKKAAVVEVPKYICVLERCENKRSPERIGGRLQAWRAVT